MEMVRYDIQPRFDPWKGKSFIEVIMDLSEPKSIPRCDCGQVTGWVYDEDNGEWYSERCWRCLEIQLMKDPSDIILKVSLPWDDDMKDRFIQLMMDTSVLSERMTVTRYQGKVKTYDPFK